MKKGIIVFYFCSLVLNAFGNSMMITAHFGSPPWTGAGQNISIISSFSIGFSMLILQILALFLTNLLGTKLTSARIIKGFLLTFIYSMMVDFFTRMFSISPIPHDLWVRVIFEFVGINFIASGVSIYIKIGSVLMPADYLLRSLGKITRNIAFGSFLSQLVPISISIIISIFRHEFTNGLGLGTIIYIVLSGFFIDFYSRKINLPKLKPIPLNS